MENRYEQSSSSREYREWELGDIQWQCSECTLSSALGMDTYDSMKLKLKSNKDREKFKDTEIICKGNTDRWPQKKPRIMEEPI